MSKFMESQDAHIARFETEFNLQQTEMTNNIDNLLKALNTQILPPPQKDARNTNSGPQIKDPSSSKQVHFVNVVAIKPVDEVKEVEVDRDNRRIEVE